MPAHYQGQVWLCERLPDLSTIMESEMRELPSSSPGTRFSTANERRHELVKLAEVVVIHHYQDPHERDIPEFSYLLQPPAVSSRVRVGHHLEQEISYIVYAIKFSVTTPYQYRLQRF